MEAKHGPPGDRFDWAKYHLPDELIDWMDVFIVHHAEHTFIPDQWERIKHKRVIWRTVGQSVEGNEEMMAPYHAQGLQIVRYSPKERNIPGFAGEDALIRFYKDPEEWNGWHGGGGKAPTVINITQRLKQRDPFTNYGFWREATRGLSALPMGPGSEDIDGPGELTYDEMRIVLRAHRAYLYTGTQPASYTLGLIEAMMTGIPIVSISPEFMAIFPTGRTCSKATRSPARPGWGGIRSGRGGAGHAEAPSRGVSVHRDGGTAVCGLGVRLAADAGHRAVRERHDRSSVGRLPRWDPDRHL